MRFPKKPLLIATVACIAASGVLAFNFTGGKWNMGRSTFHVSIPGNAPSGQSWDSAFINAMDQWTTQTDFTFDVNPNPVDPCAGLGPSRNPTGFPSGAGDGRNSAGFRNTVCGNTFENNVLALTLTLYQPSRTLGFDSIGQTDIIFNGNRSWDIYSGPLRSSVDFGRVALHELGHALGLGHENNTTSIMSSSINNLDSLQVDDIAGVNAIYGARGNCAFSDIQLNTRVNEALQAGDCRVMDLFGGNDDPSFMDVYQFSLAAPTYMNIHMQSNELDPVLIITNRALGNQMIFDDFNGTCDARVDQTLPAGDYLLIANTYVVPKKCGSNVGNYSIVISDSPLPSVGAVINTNAGVQLPQLLFSGGASVDGVNFRTSFSAQELIDVHAQITPDPAHVGVPGSIYVVAILSNGQQYMENSAGTFLPFSGRLQDLLATPYRQGVLSAREPINVVENLRGASTGLAGQQVRILFGYATASAPSDIYYNSVPITFSIAPN